LPGDEINDTAHGHHAEDRSFEERKLNVLTGGRIKSKISSNIFPAAIFNKIGGSVNPGIK
jgi:hypothetical protein